jgi:exosortase D (VPLPA-CTERM-specific)
MRWRFSHLSLGLLVLAIGALIWAFAGGLQELVVRWDSQPEYGHGYVLPLVAGYLIWEQRFALQKLASAPSWWAVMLVLIALGLFVIGELSALFLLIHYAFILVLVGLAGALIGWRGTRLILIPLSFLVFAVPLPYFVEAQLTARLQLWSSQMGVEFIRLWNIPVFLEGNLIDLGKFRMAVVEACSGLAYLYPLLGLGCICAYLFRASWWKRLLLILSTIPIAIMLNSLRIGLIGVLVQYFGPAVAEGFLHDFQGWAVFGVCVAVLVVEMWLLNFRNNDGIGLETPSTPAISLDTDVATRPLSKPFLVTLALIGAAAVFSGVVNERVEQPPARSAFSDFPTRLGDWHGQVQVLDPGTISYLGMTDYLLADYNNGNALVNIYVAYYASQRKGFSPHSPLVCLPGGGWTVSNTELHEVTLGTGTDALKVKRAVIRKGEVTELMYYWFQERGRQMNDEYVMKWYLLRDALMLGRSDGALVRVRTALEPGESEADMDARLTRFVVAAAMELPRFLPE